MAKPEDRKRADATALIEALRLHGLIVGTVLGCAVQLGLLVALGYWLDREWNCKPWLTAVGAVLGTTLALYSLGRTLWRAASGKRGK